MWKRLKSTDFKAQVQNTDYFSGGEKIDETKLKSICVSFIEILLCFLK